MSDRRQTLLALATAAAPWLTGCHPGGRPLQIGSHVWPGYELMFLARELGWHDGLQQRLVEVPSASDSMHALAAGLIDGAALTLDEVLRVRDSGVPVTVVLVFDISAGADCLLARPSVRSLAGLAGKRIGYEQTALGALMLAEVLKAAGLKASQVHGVSLHADEHDAAWHAGRVDAIITYEPTSSRLEQGGALRLFDSRSLPDTIIDVLAVTPQALRTHAETLAALAGSHFRALRYFNDNTVDACYRMAARLKLPANQVISAFSGLRMPGLNDNLKLLGGQPAALDAVARRVAELLHGSGLLNGRDAFNTLSSSTVLKAQT